MKTRIKTSFVVALMAALGVIQTSLGQSMTDSLAMDEHQIISSIAPYPADMRAAILDVAQYPQALVKLERVQARSSQSFQDLMAPLHQDDQSKMYEASRFPETVSQIVIAGKQNPDKVKSIVKDFPDALQQQILYDYENHFDEMVKMDKIYQTSQGTIQTVTEKYPKSVQDNFNKILTNPDVMSLLTDNIDLTVSLGDAYKSDPKGITQELDKANKDLSDQSEKDLNSYKDTVSKDPKLQEEMKNAANDYVQQNPVDNSPTYVGNSYYDSAPYPYWFGYPYWYASPMWYPRPYYYQTGFYYGAGGGMVIVGMPSMGYSRWFFRRGYVGYPGLYGYYHNYYVSHPRNVGNVYRGFNHNARNFYSNRTSTTIRNNTTNNNWYNGGRSRGNTAPRNTSPSRNVSPGGTSSGRMNQLNVQKGNVNSQGLQRFHANTYHNMGWQQTSPARGNTGGGASRGFSSGGGARSFGGGGGGRGFSGGGGGGGGRRGR